MPELPEVETIRRRLSERVLGLEIAAITVLKAKSFIASTERKNACITAKILRVVRRAKILQLELSNDLILAVHLKMTGQLIVQSSSGQRVGGGHPTADWVRDLPSSHTRVQIDFTDGSKLFFNDQRVFGWIKVMTESERQLELAKYGKDIIDPSWTAELLAEKLGKTRMPIKLALLNSALVAGLGNIYVCDALNLAQISPFRPANSLNLKEVSTLLVAAVAVTQRGIELGGTTFDGLYVDTDGFAGGYQREVLTYGREGLPCRHCGALIQKTKLGGRGTYYCPNCQL